MGSGEGPMVGFQGWFPRLGLMVGSQGWVPAFGPMVGLKVWSHGKDSRADPRADP